jgi:hypothetical protein
MKSVGLFIEATFIPSYEGATQRFITLARGINASNNYKIIVFHCYRGLSDLTLIENEEFTTYAFNPKDYYQKNGIVRTIIEKENVEVLIMSDYFSLLKIGLPLKKINSNLKILYEAHDVNFKYNESIGNLNRIEYKCEISAFSNSELITTFSEFDKSVILKCIKLEKLNLGVSEVLKVPFGLTNNDLGQVEWEYNGYKIVFLGNFYHTPNKIALEQLIHTMNNTKILLPKEFEILIVGNCPSYIQKNTNSRINFIGKTDDLNSILEGVSLAISPIFSGSGIKVKIIDYFIAGIPVLCSLQSLRGIVSKEELTDFNVLANMDDLISEVLKLLSNPEKLKEMSYLQKKVIKKHSMKNAINSIIQTLNILDTIPQKEINLSRLEVEKIPTPYFHEHFIKRKRIYNYNVKDVLKIN